MFVIHHPARATPRRRPLHFVPPRTPLANPVDARLLGLRVVRRRAHIPQRRRVLHFSPPPVNTITVNQHAAGFYRIADPTLAQYELYRGVDASPDFTSPWQTSATLPITTSALAGGHVYHLVLRLRDAWNLLSQNVSEQIYDLAGGGAINPAPPSPPQAFTAVPAAGGTIQVSAEYLPDLDGQNAGNLFLIFITTDGSTPNPAGATTATAPVINADGVAKYSATFGPYAESTIFKVLVRIRRSGTPNVDSTNTAPVTAIATLLGPSAPIGVASLGEVAE